EIIHDPSKEETYSHIDPDCDPYFWDIDRRLYSLIEPERKRQLGAMVSAIQVACNLVVGWQR
ncbi:MAG: hypothetical protein KDA60_13245, partial [Planctomycetales bacterium]|nr:hypothetical protein [Planctomycetales bacterium]